MKYSQMAYKIKILFNDKTFSSAPSLGKSGVTLAYHLRHYPTPFCEALREIAKQPGDKLYLTTGYHTKFSAIIMLGKEKFIPNLESGFLGCSQPEIILLGGKYKDHTGTVKGCNFFDGSSCEMHPKEPTKRPCNRCNYKYFATLFKDDINTNYKGTLKPTIFNYVNNEWHSKVTIKVAENKPVAMLIGSSNLTEAALCCKDNSNFEVDILIWDEEVCGSDAFGTISGYEFHEINPAKLLSNSNHVNMPKYIKEASNPEQSGKDSIIINWYKYVIDTIALKETSILQL